uniref:Uncharacterized protein n=1 Tax=Candidatus Kentrum sp. MB TaxID=2138164 RepID=A0A450XZ46_9GAMM|nr:MAG: hypothetical protein BECKMB1821I_GA0114274_107611 [Candidatus Kentron sp. MB]
MDVGWWDSQKNRLIMMELKGKELWKEFDANRETAHEHLVNELAKKVNDTLLILASVWSDTEPGLEIKITLPTKVRKYPGKGKIKFIFLIDTPISRQGLLMPIKDRINQLLSGKTRLFGIAHVTLIDFDKARSMELPVRKTQ